MVSLLFDNERGDIVPFDYGDEGPTGDVNLSEITARVVELQEKMRQAEQLEKRLKSLSDQITHLSSVVIPELCESANMSEFTLADGTKVSVTSRFFGKVSEEQMDAAQEFLERVGDGALIKRQISVDLGKCDEEQASHVHEALQSVGAVGEEKRSIHPSTLSSWLTQQMESGVDVPTEVFGVYRKVQTKIK